MYLDDDGRAIHAQHHEAHDLRVGGGVEECQATDEGDDVDGAGEDLQPLRREVLDRGDDRRKQGLRGREGGRDGGSLGA